jgi:hypothetical protein
MYNALYQYNILGLCVVWFLSYPKIKVKHKKLKIIVWALFWRYFLKYHAYVKPFLTVVPL